MPKRNKLPPVPDYTGMGENPEKMLVQKSNPLMAITQTGMTLSELKILDTYLARIDSHNPDKRYVQFEKGELEKLLGNMWMHKDDLVKRLKNLFQVIEIYDEDSPDEVRCISLFEEASCKRDTDGLWKVNLMCTSKAMEYIFNVENLGYLKYRLRNVVNLTSRYSYFLYLYLEKNIWLKKWEVDLKELKQILDCTAVTYLEFKEFNKQILKKSQRDIINSTDISFNYLTVKKGRKVVAISFEVERKSRTDTIIETTATAIEPPKNKTTITVPPVSQSEEKRFFGCLPKNFLHLCRNEFTEQQMSEIFQLVSEIDIPPSPLGQFPAFLTFIVDMYEKMNEYAKVSGIDTVERRFAYLKKMISNYDKERVTV